MTEDQALQQARAFCTQWIDQHERTLHEEAIPQLVALLMQASNTLTDKHSYWLGVKAGVERHSYWCNGARYVGVGATTLHEALAQVDKEMQEALRSR